MPKKGVRFTKPYQKQSSDPASVGVPNHLIPEVQKTPIDYLPFSPYDIQPEDKPVPITDYPLTSTAVNFLRGHLPLTRGRTRRTRKHILSSSESEAELSADESSEDESVIVLEEETVTGPAPDHLSPPDDNDRQRRRRHRSDGDAPTGSSQDRGPSVPAKTKSQLQRRHRRRIRLKGRALQEKNKARSVTR